MAAHVAFGARTGGSVVILGAMLLVLALFFSASVMLLFGLIPPAVLGTILFTAGAQLAASQLWRRRAGRVWVVLVVTAAVSAWHVAGGMVAGLLLQHVLLGRAHGDPG
jgi:MFS superfamily sulfate permease-like transporter